MAFGFLGSLGNIPILSKVSRAPGRDFPRGCGAWGLHSTGDANRWHH